VLEQQHQRTDLPSDHPIAQALLQRDAVLVTDSSEVADEEVRHHL
jgi:hypothetical protein